MEVRGIARRPPGSALSFPRVQLQISFMFEVFHKRGGKNRKRKACLGQSGPASPRR